MYEPYGSQRGPSVHVVEECGGPKRKKFEQVHVVGKGEGTNCPHSRGHWRLSNVHELGEEIPCDLLDNAIMWSHREQT